MSGNLNKAVNENREAIKLLVQSLEVPPPPIRKSNSFGKVTKMHLPPLLTQDTANNITKKFETPIDLDPPPALPSWGYVMGRNPYAASDTDTDPESEGGSGKRKSKRRRPTKRRRTTKRRPTKRRRTTKRRPTKRGR